MRVETNRAGSAAPSGMTGYCECGLSTQNRLVKPVFHQNGWSSLSATSGSSSVGFLRKPIASRRSKAAHVTTQLSQKQLSLRFGGQIGHQTASRQKPSLNGVIPAEAQRITGPPRACAAQGPGSATAVRDDKPFLSSAFIPVRDDSRQARLRPLS